MKKTIVLSLACFLSYPVLAAGKLSLNVELNPAGSFQATSENISGDIVKKGSQFSAKEIKLPIESLKTGIDLRDEHLWKHLNYKKHGTAVLTNLKGENGVATADLEVSGVKKPVKIKFKEKGDNILASFKVNAHDFKLPEAEYMGVGAQDEVAAEVAMPFKKI